MMSRCVFLVAGLTLFTTKALAKDYFVATTGSDTAPGTIDQPFATLQHGASVAQPGDTVYVRGGVYRITTPHSTGAGIDLTKSGTSDANRIRFWAYDGEVPVFDFAGMTISSSGYTHGFSVSGSWLHIKGFEIKNVPMNTRSNNGMVLIKASNDIIELMNFHHNSGTGLFINGGNGGHLVLNCDSHDNYDATSSQGDGQNADGFGVHYQTSGPSTTLRGCRAWWNSDDGYDLINQEVPVTIEGSWAAANGYANSGTTSPSSGNGNGFKAGSSKTGVRHVVRNCTAWKNKASGFYANHSSGGNDWFNNTSYGNGTQYNMLASPPGDSSQTIVLTGTLAHKMRNNVGYPSKNANMDGVDSASNTWDLNIVPAAGDFASISDPMTPGSGALAARQADGSLPAMSYLHLTAGSRMIDRGVAVGLPFAGAAPDLGAFEYSAGGAGGASGAGGRTGTGGVAGSGGRTGTGGASGAGGAPGTGGVPGIGGASGTGGASASGGQPGSGGAASDGGLSGTGGTVGTGGHAVHDGTTDPQGCSCSATAGSLGGLPAAFLMLLVAAILGRRR